MSRDRTGGAQVPLCPPDGAPKGSLAPGKAADWSGDFFDFLGPHYHELYEGLHPARSRREIAAVLDLTGVVAPAAVVDLGCGTGRHLPELARRGFAVTGVDQSEAMLAAARRRLARARIAAGTGAGEVELQRQDLRRLALSRPARLAISLFNTFGYGSDADNAAMLRAAAAALAPGGFLVVEMFHRDHYLREFLPTTWEKKRSFYELTNMVFDCASSRFEIDAIYVFEDHREGHHFSIRVYSCPEMLALLEQAGLATLAIFGGLDRRPLTLAADRLVLVARKGQAPAPRRARRR